MKASSVGVVFTTDQAPGAWPNGSVVLKANSQPGDASPDGTRGQIIGSIDARHLGKPAQFAYFLTWTGSDVPVFTVDTNDDGTPRLVLAP